MSTAWLLKYGQPTPPRRRGASRSTPWSTRRSRPFPDERLISERQLLQPLPSLRLQIGAALVLRRVDRLSCVRYGSARYSVPSRLVGATMAVVPDHGAVCLVEPSTGMIVAEHELVALGNASILDAD